MEPERSKSIRSSGCNRYEFYVQDSWRAAVERDARLWRCGTPCIPPVTDKNDVLTNFDPDVLPGRALRTQRAGTIVVGTGDPLNGIVVAGQNSPHGRAIYQTDKNNFQPRVGFSWDMFSNGRHGDARRLRYLLRPAARRHLSAERVRQSAVRGEPAMQNAQLSNPGSGITPTTRPVANLIAPSDPFDTPRIQQWNVGVQRQLYPPRDDGRRLRRVGRRQSDPACRYQPAATGWTSCAPGCSTPRDRSPATRASTGGRHGEVPLQRPAGRLPPRSRARGAA